jgi:hypothetical protein
MMFIGLLDDDVQQVTSVVWRDQNTWNTIQDHNWIFLLVNNESESNKIIEWNTEQKSNEDEY